MTSDGVVLITGSSEPLGRVGCSLLASPLGFPMDTGKAQQNWKNAERSGVTCRFSYLPAGLYAVSVGHDRNGSQCVDTNLAGLPTGPWVVSNNVRPNLQAPRFDEAAPRHGLTHRNWPLTSGLPSKAAVFTVHPQPMRYG